MLNGKTLDVTPILESGTQNLFGPEMGPRILIDKRNMYTVPPDVENEMLHNGFHVQTHEADPDPEHLQSHMKAAAQNGDPMAVYKEHMALHMLQLQKKKEMQQGQQGAPGGPGGAGPGVAGAPRPGAMPGPPKPGGQQPPGAIHPDAMADPSVGGRG
jgi:hypothetical protein